MGEILKDLRDGTAARQHDCRRDIERLVSPEEECVHGTKDKRKSRKLEGRKREMLNAAATTLDEKPDDLHKCKGACKTVGFIFIPDCPFL